MEIKMLTSVRIQYEPHDIYYGSYFAEFEITTIYYGKDVIPDVIYHPILHRRVFFVDKPKGNIVPFTTYDVIYDKRNVSVERIKKVKVYAPFKDRNEYLVWKLKNGS